MIKRNFVSLLVTDGYYCLLHDNYKVKLLDFIYLAELHAIWALKVRLDSAELMCSVHMRFTFFRLFSTLRTDVSSTLYYIDWVELMKLTM